MEEKKDKDAIFNFHIQAMKIRDKNIYLHDRKIKSKNIVPNCYHYSQMHLHYII